MPMMWMPTHLTLHLYDPNTGASDGCQLSIRFPTRRINAHTEQRNIHPLPIRGFFRVDYGVHDASALAPPPPVLSVSSTPYPVPGDLAQTVTVTPRMPRRELRAGNVLINASPLDQTKTSSPGLNPARLTRPGRLAGVVLRT